MDDIRFRAWDKEQNQMLTMPTDTLYGISRFFGFIPDEAILMQFTGLCDKNGKGDEVYADDVIGLSGVQYKVFWNNERGQWYTLIVNEGVKGKHYKPLWEILSSSYSKVIGNIHEEKSK